MYGHTYSKGKDQLGKVANPARDQLNRENALRLFFQHRSVLYCVIYYIICWCHVTFVRLLLLLLSFKVQTPI